MAARGLTDGPRGYGFLPPLQEVGREPEFPKLFPTLARLLEADAQGPSKLETPGLSPQRRRLLERAAEQARPPEKPQLKPGDGSLLESEEQLLHLLSSLLAQEREEVRMETEAKLRAAFSAPPGERRTLIEAQRQKWRALEDTVKELTGLVRKPAPREKGMDPEEYNKMREMKASSSLHRLKSLEAASLRAKVIALGEMVEIFQSPGHWKEAGGAVTSLLKMGMGEDIDDRIERLKKVDPLEAAKMRQQAEMKRNELENEMRGQIKEELLRQAEMARNLEHEEAARAQALEIEELQRQLADYEQEKQRMENEIVTLREANMTAEAEEIEQRLQEESSRNLQNMQGKLSQRASTLGRENENLKKQLAEQEEKRKQMEEEEKRLKEAQKEVEEQRRLNNQNAFAGKMKTKQAEALKKQAEESEKLRKEAQEEYEQLKVQAAMAAKLKSAAGAHRQAELQQQAEDAEKRMKEAEQRGKVVNQMLGAAMKTQKEEIDKQSQQWKEDKHKLLYQMRNQQLEIAAMAVLERQRLLKANRAARLENFRQQWWSEVDVQRVSTANHLLLRCVRAAKPGVHEDAARSIGKIKSALHESRRKIVDSQASQSSTVAEDEGKLRDKELKEQLENGIRASDTYLRKMEPHLRQLAPGPELEDVFNDGGFPSPSSRHAAVIEDSFLKEREQMEEQRAKAQGRLLEAEAQLDALAKDEIAADLASNWASSVGAMADEKRMAEIRRKELQARIEGELARETGADIQRAKAASASAAAAAAASAAANEVERQRAEEENRRRVEAALREADQQRLVPVRLKLNGFKMSQVRDKAAFERAFAEKIRATLDLDESQLRVLEVSAGTG